jgi:hypothetical protein
MDLRDVLQPVVERRNSFDDAIAVTDVFALRWMRRIPQAVVKLNSPAKLDESRSRREAWRQEQGDWFN